MKFSWFVLTKKNLLFLEAWRVVERAYYDNSFNGKSWFRCTKCALRDESMSTSYETCMIPVVQSLPVPLSIQLFEHSGKPVTNHNFKQWEGLLDLLCSDIGSAGGLEFLHWYHDFERFLQHALEGRTSEAARQTVEFLIQLMRNPSTPQCFCLLLLHDSVSYHWLD